MKAFAVSTLVAFFAVPAGAEPFFVERDGQRVVDEAVMAQAIEACWSTFDDLSLSGELPCATGASTDCIAEMPGFGTAKIQEVLCLAEALFGWNAVLEEETAVWVKVAAEQDTAEAESPITLPFRSPAIPGVIAAWQAHRDADCDYTSRQYRLGFPSVLATQCSLDMTVARIIQVALWR